VLWGWRALALLAVITAAVWLGQRGLPDGRLHVYFLDVGQGDAILLRTPDGRQILVDGGPSPAALLDALGDQMPFWDHSLDLVILTHPDGDHMEGLLALPARYAIGQAVDAVDASSGEDAAAWIGALTEAGVPHALAQRGMQIRAGDLLLTVLNPGPEHDALVDDGNAGSLVLRLDYGETSLLLTGDTPQSSEEEMLAAGLPLDADALKVAHHGSAGSSSARFLAAVSPDVAVIQVGANNDYGHPAPDVLDRLQGIEVWRTDLNGRVEMISDGARLWVKPERRP
jgi:competence protein ComEC